MFPSPFSFVFLLAELAILSSGYRVSVYILLEFEPYFHKLVTYMKVVQMSTFKLNGKLHGLWGCGEAVQVSSAHQRLPT